jgi:hypothetical protein
LSAGAYSGENPPEGASLSYYLPAAARVSVEILDASGRTVRAFDAPGAAGVERTTWDLTETPPVEWKSARTWNRGGPGATVLPGRYTVRLHAGSRVLTADLAVAPDPRAGWTQAQYLARYRFVTNLNAMLSAIDMALNRLDTVMVSLSPGVMVSLSNHDVQETRALFTSGAANSEYDVLVPDRLRERLTILQGVIALSQGPPTEAQEREAAAICAQFKNAMTAYQAFLNAHNLPPDKEAADCE